jgi:hypothetical protein
MQQKSKSQPIDDGPFGPDGLLRDGKICKFACIALLAPTLTLTANAPIIRT